MAQLPLRGRPTGAGESHHKGEMKYPPRLLDDIRARLPVSQVVARKVALKRSGREFRGLSPFKVEKSPSFFVNDQKGFYHCFATGEHGDIFTFVMKTEGLSFPETVEQLAAEAGVPMPKIDVRDAQKEDERGRLQALLEASAKWFEDNLRGAVGADARRYLQGRGLEPETIRQFRIGFAPDSRRALKEHLGKLGYTIDEMIRSGMLIGGEDIKEPYDRFRNRVMFPISDLKDRPIAFGGRALAKDEKAKYLNSPETPLFHKGSILFNAAKARSFAHDKQRLILVEGYMDVVALSAAGFGESVAPLGTALTEEQMQLVWRFVPEPTLCFDGDSAGKKAAWRAIDTMLPGLKPGYSANFAFLPDGLDPDDLVRQEGADAVEAVLARAQPLAEALWDREFSSGNWSTPERKAKLQQQIMALVSRIEDPAVRALYTSAMRERLAAAWGPRRNEGRQFDNSFGEPGANRYGQPRSAAAAARNPHRIHPGRQEGGNWERRNQGGQRPNGNRPRWGEAQPVRPIPSNSLRRSSMVETDAGRPPYREALLMRVLINHPFLLEADLERISALGLNSGAMMRLRDALIGLSSAEIPLDRGAVHSQLSKLGLDKLVELVERSNTHKSDRFADPDAAAIEAEKGWRHTLALHEQQVGMRRALVAAERELDAEGSEDAWSRIVELQKLLASTDELQLPSES